MLKTFIIYIKYFFYRDNQFKGIVRGKETHTGLEQNFEGFYLKKKIC